MKKYLKIILIVLVSLFLGFYVGYFIMPRSADINRDGKVNLIDASILFHYYK